MEFKLQVYNGLDCCVTFEVHHKLQEELVGRPNCQRVYNFERGMCAPALEMSLRGWRVDMAKRAHYISQLEWKIRLLQHNLDQLATEVWGRPLNPRSPKQFQEFFYGVLRIPEIIKYNKGERKVSTDRDALEKLEAYIYARPFVLHILKIRELSKQLSVLYSGVDNDRRIRCSYNPAATTTGRWSSSENVFGTGTNLQNITEELRQIFIADSGFKLAVPDLEQAESRIVGAIVKRIFHESTYLDACESGDLHTVVSMMIWEHLEWERREACGDQEEFIRRNRAIAERVFYRHFSYRDMAKRGGHATNYMATPRTGAKHLKVAVQLIETFQQRYYAAFPGLRKWQLGVATQVMTKQELVTQLGRERQFFGRPDDDATIREAVAHEPQSICGDILNVGLWRLWKHHREIQLLGQIHDAVAFQYPDNRATEGAILERAAELLVVPIDFGDFQLTIPCEMKVGWNWRPVPKKTPDENPDGLIKWKGSDLRVRQYDPENIGLDTILS